MPRPLPNPDDTPQSMKSKPFPVGGLVKPSFLTAQKNIIHEYVEQNGDFAFINKYVDDSWTRKGTGIEHFVTARKDFTAKVFSKILECAIMFKID